jgi:hypothetical protein
MVFACDAFNKGYFNLHLHIQDAKSFLNICIDACLQSNNAELNPLDRVLACKFTINMQCERKTGNIRGCCMEGTHVLL